MQVAAVNLLASGGDALVQAFSSSRKRRTVFKGLGDLTFDASRLLRLNPPDSVIVGASTRQRAHQSDAANANIQQAVSRTQSLELHLSEVYDTVSNLEELRGQASQTNLTDAQRTEINTEYQALLESITARADVVEFNDAALLKGGEVTLTISPPDSEMTLSNGNILLSHLGLDGTTINTRAAADAAETTITDALANLDRQITQVATEEETLLGRLRANDFEVGIATEQAMDCNATDQPIAEMAATANYIRTNIDQAAGIQAQNLRTSTLTALLESMEAQEPEVAEKAEPEEEAGEVEEEPDEDAEVEVTEEAEDKNPALYGQLTLTD